MYQLLEMVSGQARTLNTTVGDKIAACITARKWKELKLVEIPTDLDPDSYWAHAQCRDLLSRMEGLPGAASEQDLKESCLKDFLSCEAHNLSTNRLFNFLFPLSGERHLHGPTEERLVEFLGKVKKEIRALLGPLPLIEELNSRFGPGATFCRVFPHTSVGEKLNFVPTHTSAAWPWLLDWSQSAWARSSTGYTDDDFWVPFAPWRSPSNQVPELVRGNRFTTVPKDSLKRRGICIEPALNVYYQLGYGSYLRERLKTHWAIDLQYGQEKHKRMAREGSLHGHLATLDLSSASDLISRELVRALLPKRWYHVLNALRSRFTKVDGKWKYLEKFSSMGNGFTFELETIIFHAIVRVCVQECTPYADPCDLVKRELLGQYGDDCVVPEGVVKSVVGAFRVCGFKINEQKSFVDGPFRESCGGDYLCGVDVRTFKLKELPDAPEKWISFANGLWSVVNSNGFSPARLAIVRQLHRWCLSNIPSPLRRLKGPSHLGDLVVHGFPADWQKPLTFGGVEYYKGYLPVSNMTPWDHFPPGVRIAAALYGASSNGCPWPDPPVKGHRVRWIGKPRDLKVRRGIATSPVDKISAEVLGVHHPELVLRLYSALKLFRVLKR